MTSSGTHNGTERRGVRPDLDAALGLIGADEGGLILVKMEDAALGKLGDRLYDLEKGARCCNDCPEAHPEGYGTRNREGRREGDRSAAEADDTRRDLKVMLEVGAKPDGCLMLLMRRKRSKEEMSGRPAGTRAGQV